MDRPLHLLKRFVRDPGGATAVEYGLLLALISIVVIGAVTATGTRLFGTMNAVSNALGGS